MSEVKVNKISPRTNCGTTQLGDAGDTITVTGDLKSNSLKPATGTTLTLGASGDTITLAAGASQSGFGRTGTVDWDTTAKTASFTAVSGNGYFVNTTSGAITVTLPAGSAGDIVGISDYASTFQNNNLTITPNGTDKINGQNENAVLSTQGVAVSLVYVDATRGWKSVTGSDNDTTGLPPYIQATGGTTVVCGNYKTHIFTGPGTFCISSIADCAADNVVDYLVIAGGGGGAGANGPGCGGRGGGGAGGGRTFQSTPVTNPLTAPVGITVTATSYPITVGGGGSAGPPSGPGGQGNNSIFSSITSAGGGYGAQHPASGNPGGSGGGSYSNDPAGLGNVPPVSPPQGNPALNIPGGTTSGGNGGGGWGASPPGSAPLNAGTAGGAGSYIYDTFIGPTAPSYGEGSGPVANARYFAGGGGGGGYNAAGGAGGIGGGGCGVNSYGPGGCGSPAIPGDANTGGGGGSVGAAGPTGTNGGAGGSGIVMIRYKYQ